MNSRKRKKRQLPQFSLAKSRFVSHGEMKANAVGEKIAASCMVRRSRKQRRLQRSLQ